MVEILDRYVYHCKHAPNVGAGEAVVTKKKYWFNPKHGNYRMIVKFTAEIKIVFVEPDL